MPTLLIMNGIEVFTLPAPFRGVIKAGQPNYFRDEPTALATKLFRGGPVPGEFTTQTVAASAVPAGSYLYDPPDDSYVAEVATTDATPTLLWSLDLDDNTVYRFRVDVAARCTSAAGRGTYTREFQVYREAAGVATLGGGGVTASVADDESDAAWDVNVIVSSNAVQVYVTGAAATNITWDGAISLISARSFGG